MDIATGFFGLHFKALTFWVLVKKFEFHSQWMGCMPQQAIKLVLPLKKIQQLFVT